MKSEEELAETVLRIEREAYERGKAEALALKVVGPGLGGISTPKEIALKILYDTPIPEGCDFEVNGIDQAKKVARYQAHIVSLIEKAIEAQLTLAPKEQVIRVPVIGLKEFESKVLENGFDHPCRKTCSGWTQGYDRGRFDFQEAIKRLNPQARIEESNE